MFKNLWNKITSSLRPERPPYCGYQPGQATSVSTPTEIPQKPEYSETIDNIVYVTETNALRLIRDKAGSPPSEELKTAVKNGMFDSLAMRAYDVQKETLGEAFSTEEISNVIGSRKDFQAIIDDSDEKEKFMKETGVQTRPSTEELIQAKEDIKAAIPSQQAARSKAIKKKKASSKSAKKRKNK